MLAPEFIFRKITISVKMAKLENYLGSVIEGQSEQKRLVKLIIIDPFFLS